LNYQAKKKILSTKGLFNPLDWRDKSIKGRQKSELLAILRTK